MSDAFAVGLTTPYGYLAQYGSLSLTASSPPQSFTEPLTLAQVKSYLNLPERQPPDPAEDAGLLSLISAARNQAEIMQGRDLVRKQWDLALDYFSKWHIRMRAPLASVDLVRYRTADGAYTTMTEDTDYIVDAAKEPGVIVPPYGRVWPLFVLWPSSAVLVRFTSGFTPTDAWWSSDGDRVKNGMLMLISAWFNNRLPFEIGASAIQEYPYTVTACLSFGGLKSAR